MAQQQQTTTKSAPRLAPVISAEACVYQLTYLDPAPPLDAIDQERVKQGLAPRMRGDRKANVVKVLPGLNYLDEDAVLRSGFDFDATHGKIRLEEPTKVPAYLAITVAQTTTSRSALAKWLADEKAIAPKEGKDPRAEVREAIEARLKEIK